ncbi:FxsB family cyclophane-forming radical SAM/SPASM peptide maturase [Streptomyces odontomachi]|uniref:FxsB family cyclophane-forming radical SAM/SPASM peptide maturase n=1 Tax=Streptomyces odontomachi TaxID=2944940 RepID=UPI00210AEF46|nr:FxsB family cyclophane-forming radical SAM/SPASM peptide maturase [Streptomyces sp. ODS25]
MTTADGIPGASPTLPTTAVPPGAHPAHPHPHPRWPHATLDTRGHRPVPFRQFVLKVHSRCNLACTYCYVYEGQDGSWRHRPVRVGEDTMRTAAARIGEHVAAHRLRRIRIELHGGEPLLSGPGPVLAYARAVRAAVPTDCRITATVQTNGTLLTEDTVGRLAAAGLRVGLSLDGGLAAHNARRRDHAGRPAWPAAHRAARLLAVRRDAYAGILCTIDLGAAPRGVYHSLLDLAPPAVDFLLPHGNWAAPPPGLDPGARPGRHRPRPTPYGDWLAALFDAWWDAERAPVRIRLFHEIVALLLGAPSTAEAVGLSPLAAVVVDTDGAIEQVDSLKSAYPGAPATGLDVRRHPFDDALRHPGIAARQLGERALAGTCRRCPVHRVCGGGNYVHRYAPGSGFRHPSVYCADLERLIRHVAHRLSHTTQPRPNPPTSPL